MSKRSTQVGLQTIGLDVGDRKSVGVVLDGSGEVVEEFSVPSTQLGLGRGFGHRERCRVALEVGTHSPWMERRLQEMGHEVLVANARKVALISRGGKKTDRVDAETLARLARLDPRLLSPIRHRSPEARRDLMVIRARDALVAARTQLVNHVRYQVKVSGERLPACSTEAFAAKAGPRIPVELRDALLPVVEQIESLTSQIRACDRQVIALCRERYPETARLQQVAGVGPLTALCFVLTLEDPSRFERGRDVGAYLGLAPRKHESGSHAPELRISKAGDATLRRLLVSAAHYVLGPFGPDTALRRWGAELGRRGRKNAKKRAVVAVARKLSVLLLSLWRSGQTYEPLRGVRAELAATV